MTARNIPKFYFEISFLGNVYISAQKNTNPSELTPKSWTPSPTKGVLFYEQIQCAVQAKES